MTLAGRPAVRQRLGGNCVRFSPTSHCSSPRRSSDVGTCVGVPPRVRSRLLFPATRSFPGRSSAAPGPSRSQAPPGLVWPWLVQVGCLRAGFYSNDLLDNLGHPSARDVVPELQQLELGQWMPMSPAAPSDATAFRVEGFEVNRWLLWRKPDSTWAWQLSDTGDGTTRLVTRVHAVYDWSDPAKALLGVILMELGDFAMMRRMLFGIKERAEELARPGARGEPS